MRWPLIASLAPVAEHWRAALRTAGLLRRFRAHLRPQAGRLLLAALASIGFALVTLIEPWPLRVIFDGVLLGQPVGFLGVDLQALVAGRPLLLLALASGSVLLLAALRGQLYYAQSVLAATAGIDVVMGIRRELFHQLQMLSLDFHRRARSGDLLMRLTGDIAMMREMVIAALVTVLSQGLVLVGVLALMASLNLRLTLIAALMIPLLLLVLSLFRVRLAQAARQQRHREGRLAASAQEVLSSVQIVQAYTAEKHEDERFQEMNKRSRRSGVRLTRIEAQLNRSVQIAMAAALCAMLWSGTRDVLGGRLTPGELLVYLAYLRALYQPLRQGSKLSQRLAKASACAERVTEVLDAVPRVADPPDPVVLRGVRGEIAFAGVTFGYQRGEPVLRDIDLEISAGEMVALVGPTGAGKTTLLALLLRFHDPWSGEIRVDGVPIRRVRLRSLRRQISLLTQEAVVMGVTVRENIEYGALGGKRERPGQARIERVARAARADEFIRELPRGYDTVIGERGATLSGGQRQRIAIARALLRKAPLLLLDEPTTGLDPISGKAVLEALEALTRGRTTLVVAHQLGTVLRADRIVFLDRGRIVEQGTHQELLACDGAYAAFFRTEWGELSSRGRPVESLPGVFRG